MTGTVIVSSADMTEWRRRRKKKKKQREVEEEAEEKDLYSGAQTRPDQARLVWVARKPARRLI